MASARRLLGYFPQLERRAWEDVAPELSRFLRRLFDSENDGLPAGFKNTTPEQVNADGSDSPGPESAGWASALHDHDIATSTAGGLGNASSEGASAELARASHVHKRDVRIKEDDADFATQNALNFLNADVEWTLGDDVGNDEVEITGKLKAASRTFVAGGTKPGVTGPTDYIVWEAAYAATVLAVRGVRINGGTGATVNARRNFTDEHLSSDLSLPVQGTVYDGGAVQNTAYVAGDIMEARVKSASGGPSDVSIFIRVRRD